MTSDYGCPPAPDGQEPGGEPDIPAKGAAQRQEHRAAEFLALLGLVLEAGPRYLKVLGKRRR